MTKQKGNSIVRHGFSSATRDLIFIAIITFSVLVFSYFFSLFDFLLEIFRRYPSAITYIDEIIAGLLTLSIGFAVFSWRRWQDLKKETAQRLKLEAELREALEIKAETERIINKQLEVEIEERKGSRER
jgi:hypothetical protein